MREDKNPALDRVTLLNLRVVARCVGRAPETIRDWVRAGTFPKPLTARSGAPLQWRLATIEAWIAARERSRTVTRTPRGQLRQNQPRKIIARWRPPKDDDSAA